MEQLTNKQPDALNQELKTNPIHLNDEESKKLAYVLSRFRDMKSKRDLVSRDWQIYVQQYEARFFPYAD